MYVWGGGNTVYIGLRAIHSFCMHWGSWNTSPPPWIKREYYMLQHYANPKPDQISQILHDSMYMNWPE